MIARLLLSLLVPWVLGLALVRLAWPGRLESWAVWLLLIGLAATLSLGIVTCLFFVWLLLPGLPIALLVAAESVVAVVLLGWSVLAGEGRKEVAAADAGGVSAQAESRY